MTFILNALHKDFSLIASDRKATSEGPISLKANGTTINIVSEGTITIEGYQKIYLSKLGNMAVGHAGNTADHGYINSINTVDNINSALSIIRSHMDEFLVQDHKRLLETQSFTDNAGIATYHESETGMFFSNIYTFSTIHSYTRLYAGHEEGCLIHVGSGSSCFSSAVGSEEIDRFAKSLKSEVLQSGLPIVE